MTAVPHFITRVAADIVIASAILLYATDFLEEEIYSYCGD